MITINEVEKRELHQKLEQHTKELTQHIDNYLKRTFLILNTLF